MVSTQVQRTLVKSPPELWAELSDPAALARHLGELGEIRITRIEPERKVEWTAEDTRGTVQIQPSGWGTRVTLTATCESSPPPPGAPAEPATTSPEPADAAPEPVGPPTFQTHQARRPEPVESEPAAPVATAAAAARLVEVVAPIPPVAGAGQSPATTAPTASPSGPKAVPSTEAPKPLTPEPGAQAPIATERSLGFFERLMRRFRGDPAGSPSPGADPAPDQPQPASVNPPPRAASASPQANATEPSADGPHADSSPPLSPASEQPSPVASGARQAPPTESHPGSAGESDPTRALATRPTPASELRPAPAAEAISAPAEARSAGAPGSEHQPAAAIAPHASAPSTSAHAPGEEVEAVLTAVLDRLGSAHHRPFSRA